MKIKEDPSVSDNFSSQQNSVKVSQSSEQEFNYPNFVLSQNESFLEENIPKFLETCLLPNTQEESSLFEEKLKVNLKMEKEKKALLKSDIKEHFKLIKATKDIILKLRVRLAEVIEKTGSRDFSVKESVSLIRVRIEALIQFCRYLCLLAIMKINGDSIDGHLIFKRLIFLKTFLTKLKPLNKKLEYQISKLLRIASKSLLDRREKLQKKEDSDSEEVVGKEEEEARKEAKLKYFEANGNQQLPNKLSKEEKKQARYQSYRKKKVLESEFVRDMMEEDEQKPREITMRANIDGVYDPMEEKLRNYEEKNFIRVRKTKEQKKKIKRRVEQMKQRERVDDMSMLEDARHLVDLQMGKERTFKGNKKKGLLVQAKKNPWNKTLKDSEIDKGVLSRKKTKFKVARKIKKNKNRRKKMAKWKGK